MAGVNAAPTVLVVGEVLADVVVVGADEADAEGPTSIGALRLIARAGGSPANVAIGLARLGVNVGFVGRLSSTGLGPWLVARLAANGLDLRFSVTVVQEPTLALVALDSDGIASYGFYGADTADWQWQEADLPLPNRLSVAAIHTGSLATAMPPGNKALSVWAAGVRSCGAALVSYDPNVRPSLIRDPAAFAAEVDSWVKLAHLVKVSEEDIAFLHPGADAADIAQLWAKEGPELVVLTRGADGSVVFRPDGSTIRASASPVTIADTVGAGDAFSSGLLAWLAEAGALRPGGPSQLRAGDLHSALRVASETASIACGRPGADPPYRSEVAGAPWP